MLILRAHFDLDITDGSGKLTAMILETLAEKILSMTAEQIYKIVAIKKEPMPTAHNNRQFAHKLFKLQLQKPLFRLPDQKPGTLAVSSFSEKEPLLLGTLPTSVTVGEGSKKAKIEPPTPTKKQ